MTGASLVIYNENCCLCFAHCQSHSRHKEALPVMYRDLIKFPWLWSKFCDPKYDPKGRWRPGSGIYVPARQE